MIRIYIFLHYSEIQLIFYSPVVIFTFRAFLFLLHLLAVCLQLLVGEFGEGVGTLLADDNLGLVLLFDDGLGCGHQLPLRDTQRESRESSETSRGETGDELLQVTHGSI